MAKRWNPQSVVVVTADSEEVAGGNPLPVTLAAADLVVGRVKLTDGTDVVLVTTAGKLQVAVQADVAATATLANVASSATNVTLQASNTSRLWFTCHNDSSQVLYIKFGATASSTSFNIRLDSQMYYEMPGPLYTGIIDGIWVSANGSARVLELT